MTQSTIPPAIQNVVNERPPRNTIVTPLTASSRYAGFANQSSSRLTPRSTNAWTGVGCLATVPSHTPYVALKPTATIASNT